MSFVFELFVDDLTEEQGRAIEARTRGAWPIEFKQLRHFPWVGRRYLELWIQETLRDGRDLLTDDAEPDAAAWDMHREHLPAFAEVALASQLNEFTLYRVSATRAG